MNIQFLGRKYSTEELIKKRRRIVRELSQQKVHFVEKKALILSGSTVGELAEQLKMFCLAKGIKLSIKQGDFGRYFEDSVFGNTGLENDIYDFIYVHVTNRNLLNIPEPSDGYETVKNKLQTECEKLDAVIEALQKKFSCPIIHNNFEMLPYRVLGNREVWDNSGAINFINRVNEYLNQKAREEKNLYINDINYLASYYGIKQWTDLSCWYRYKYAMCIDAIPLIAQNLSAIIISLLGKNKKCIVLDLDNTLWGGVIGDEGKENIIIGNDSAKGEAYLDFQKYVKQIKETGIILCVVSKNEDEVAQSGFSRKEMMLKLNDLASFTANWEPKSKNIQHTAEKLNLSLDSFIFIDDSEMERDEVYSCLPDIDVPVLTNEAHYIQDIEECRLFEVTNHSIEDNDRTNYYLQNEMRERERQKYSNYEEYLRSLNMEWTFSDFKENSFERIVQLTNKTNQFNLTTKRMNMGDIVKRALAPDSYICIQGNMRDRFGDNGLVTVLIGKITGNTLEIENWLMSCRVFRRNGEYRLFDYLLDRCKKKGIKKIIGRYIPTEKNGIVKSFYSSLNFNLVKERSNDRETIYELLL